MNISWKMTNTMLPVIVEDFIPPSGEVYDSRERVIWNSTYVGVIVHDTFGASWSQDVFGVDSQPHEESRIFCPTLVRSLLNKDSGTVLYEKAESLFPRGYNDPIVECKVYWLNVFHSYLLTEYDGKETIRVFPPVMWNGLLFHGQGDEIFVSGLIQGDRV